MSKIFLVALPLLACFISPWIHKILFTNLILADVGLSDSSAHTIALLMAVIAAYISAMIFTFYKRN